MQRSLLTRGLQFSKNILDSNKEVSEQDDNTSEITLKVNNEIVDRIIFKNNKVRPFLDLKLNDNINETVPISFNTPTFEGMSIL